MGRELKRVPKDFVYPLNKVWYGNYLKRIHACRSREEELCEQCKKFAEIKGIKLNQYGCPVYDEYFKEVFDKMTELCELPKGNGFQLWETTTEGSPVSPVFDTIGELADWCAENITSYGKDKLSKKDWKKNLEDLLYKGEYVKNEL